MAQEVTNFGRFYSAFRRLAVHGDPDDVKRDLVLQYTAGRTASLKEMTCKEYSELCQGVEEMAGMSNELKRHRSSALHQMQKMGIDTTDWNRVNSFCQERRICGKPFGRLDIEELQALTAKLRTIERKGGLRVKRDTKEERKEVIVIPVRDERIGMN